MSTLPFRVMIVCLSLDGIIIRNDEYYEENDGLSQTCCQNNEKV